MSAKLFLLMILSVTGLVNKAGNHKPENNNPEVFVDWKAERKLTWEDFKGRPDPATGNAALTSTSINIDYSYNKHELKYSIRCQFDPTKSWGRIRNTHILGHEQAHFDIAEIHARELFKALQEYKFRPSNVSQDINHIYESVMQMHHDMQAQYDGETDYSRNPPTQREWQEKIANRLQELAAYANYR